MATRSTIAIEYANGQVDQVYCHWDGYLEHNGLILQQHYLDPFKLQKLIDLGDLSSLRPEIGEKHVFSQFDLPADQDVEAYKALTENWSTFYGRDREEEGTQAKRFADFADYVENHQDEEYEYILRQIDGTPVWFVKAYQGEYIPLTEAIKECHLEEETV